MKLRWKIAIAAAVLVAAGVVIAALSLDRLAKAALEKGATSALGTETTVESLDLSVSGGSLQLAGLDVSNPDGFPQGNLLQLASAAIAFDIASLLSDTVEIREIVLDAPVLGLHQKGLDTNLAVVLKNAGAKEPANARKAGQPAGGERSSKPGKGFKIDLIKITNARLEYRLSGAAPVKLDLPDIELKDLSDKDGGPLLLADVFSQVLTSMAASAGRLPGNLVPSEIKGALDSVVSGTGKGVEETLTTAGEALKATGKSIKDVGDLFKGLGKKDKKEDE
ncbi:MAG: hypothetical protein J7M19_05450 [Planctomycetes bacterium]|nr:hypothetical protein [Planctomycetota bacterium]